MRRGRRVEALGLARCIHVGKVWAGEDRGVSGTAKEWDGGI